MQPDRKLIAAVEALRRLKLQTCFDASDADSTPTAKQESIFMDFGRVKHQYVVAGNQSGKSQSGARLAAWVLTETHPHWTRPDSWGREPLQILVIGQTLKMVEEMIWRKIEGFLDPAEIKVIRSPQGIDRVEHLPTGNKILFFSHHNSEAARKNLQGFVSHFAWIDEMPSSLALLKEIQLRVQSKDGFFLATFTPLVRNDEIRRLVDASDGVLSKKYQMSMLDNPVYAHRREELEREYEHLPEAVRRTRLHGDWATGDGSVFHFDPDLHYRAPIDYSPAWPHVEAVDPGAGTKLGYTLWAYDPVRRYWTCIKAKYVSGLYAPSKILEAVVREGQGVNLVDFIVDGHETWFRGAAAEIGRNYRYPNKSGRKMELIKNLQEGLGKDVFIAPWCTDLGDELISCTWNANETEIVGKSRFHLIDATEYFYDLKPEIKPAYVAPTWEQTLLDYNRRLRAEAAKSPIAPTSRNARVFRKRMKKWN